MNTAPTELTVNELIEKLIFERDVTKRIDGSEKVRGIYEIRVNNSGYHRRTVETVGYTS